MAAQGWSLLTARSTAAAVELAASTSTPGRWSLSQRRHCPVATGIETILVTWSSVTPGLAISRWVMGSRTSRTTCRLSTSWARMSAVTTTVPSMAFSMATMAHSTAPSATARMVSAIDG